MAKKSAKRSRHSAATRSSKKKPARARASLKDFCRSLPGTTEDVKWIDHLVFSIGGKMYAIFNLDDEEQFSLKCSDEDYDRLTCVEGIIPAPYAARFSWVKAEQRRAQPDAEWRTLLAHARELVLAGLPKKARASLHAG